MFGLYIFMANGDLMAQKEWFEYDEEGDVLDVYFAEKRPS